MSISRAVLDGMRQGFAEGIADLRARLFLAGVLIGSGSAAGALLSVGAVGQPFVGKTAGICVVCLLTGVAMFSLPTKGAPP